MYEIVELEQNTPEWLEFRNNYIGASDANIIMGLSKYCTRAKLLEQKRNPENIINTESYAANLGHKVEEKKRPAVSFEFDLDLKPVVMKKKGMPLTASLDGWDQKKKVPWEHKLLGAEDFENAKKGIFPEKYKPQVQQQLFITEAEYLLFTITNWHNHEDSVHLKVEPDVTYQNKLLVETGKFFDEWKSEEEDEIRCKIKDLLESYTLYAGEYQKFKKLVDETKQQIFDILPEKKYEIDGVKITESEPVERKVIDYKKIVVDNKVNLEQYTSIVLGKPKQTITFKKDKL